MLNNKKKLNNNLNFKIFLSTLKILQIWIRIWAWFSWLHLLHVYMYVSIKDNSSAMNSYLEYMHGPTDTENRWIITIDTLYCCVLLHARNPPSCSRHHSRSDSRDSKITYTCTRSGTAIAASRFYDLLWCWSIRTWIIVYDTLCEWSSKICGTCTQIF